MIKLDPDGIYSEAELAAAFGVSADKVRRDRQTGVGPPFVKYGRQAYYRGSDLISHLEQSRRTSTSEARP